VTKLCVKSVLICSYF